MQALQASGHKGALVALDVKTGDVLAMASSPSYDPNALADRGAFAALNRDEANAPLVNRATQNGYPPGSTMKVVTAAAALDTGRFNPQSRRQRRERQADLRRPAEQLRAGRTSATSTSPSR